MSSPKDEKVNTDNLNDKSGETKSGEMAEPKEPEIIEQDLRGDAENVAELVHHAQDELTAVQDKYLRLAAEFDNYKKRSEREKQSSVKYATEGLLQELLPILDNLEQALQAAESGAGDEKSQQNMIVGIKMVLKHFQDTLSRFGIQQFSAKGQSFDPLKHEAVSEQEDENTPGGQVLEEYQKGYMLHERLVRPARVVVSKEKNTKE